MKAGVVRHEDHDDTSQSVDATGSIVTIPSCLHLRLNQNCNVGE